MRGGEERRGEVIPVWSRKHLQVQLIVVARYDPTNYNSYHLHPHSTNNILAAIVVVHSSVVVAQYHHKKSEVLSDPRRSEYLFLKTIRFSYSSPYFLKFILKHLH